MKAAAARAADPPRPSARKVSALRPGGKADAWKGRSGAACGGGIEQSRKLQAIIETGQCSAANVEMVLTAEPW